MAHTATFQYPDHFNPQRELDAYNQGYYPIYGAEPYGRDQQILGYNDRLVIAGKQWGMDHNYSSAITADPKNGNALIIVDGNGDFVIPNGALAVPGAMGDMDRVVRWIYQNLGRIDHIVASMDAHYPIQIFHPAFWIDRKTGQMPAPFTEILAKHYGTRYQPLFEPDFDPDWIKHYLDSLAKTTRDVFNNVGKRLSIQHESKPLRIWTTHTVLGTPMQALVPMIADALIFWASARGKNYEIVQKGINLWTEWYSILESDVAVPNDPYTLINANIIETLMSYKRVYICGWAKSHCVYETIQSLVWYLKANAAHLLPNLYLIMDGMSSVGAIKDAQGNVLVDFEAMVEPQYKAWEAMGVNLVYTTDNGGQIAA
jgi:nicotinamidase-related amidase